MTYQTAGNLLLILAAIPANGAPLVFAAVTWWRSRWGVHLMAYMCAVALVLDLAVARLIWGDSWWFQGIRAAAFALVVGALWWRFVFVIQALREGSPDESSRTDEEKLT